jgi:hypothetical protein
MFRPEEWTGPERKRKKASRWGVHPEEHPEPLEESHHQTAAPAGFRPVLSAYGGRNAQQEANRGGK